MTERPTTVRKAVPWLLLGVSVALWSFEFFLVFAGRPSSPNEDAIGVGGIFVAFAAMVLVSAVGTIVCMKRPDHPIGWILSVVAFLVAVRSVTDGWVLYGPAVFGQPLPARTVVAWLSGFVWIPAIGMLGTFFFLLFPTGTLPSRRWRVVGWLAVLGIGAAVLSAALDPGPLEDYAGIQNPLPLPAEFESVSGALALGYILLVAAIGASIVSVGVRARRARDIEREQIKWIAFAGSLFAIGFTLVLLSEEFNTLAAIGVFGPIAALAVAAGIAIQRYRLFDIDRIISRTLSYAIVTVVVGGAFALVVLAPAVVIGSGGATPDYQIAFATLIAAALFRPVAGRAQRTVDRRFNRARYDAEHTIDAFTMRLREQVDIDALGAELGDVVRRTMHPQLVSIWLRPERTR